MTKTMELRRFMKDFRKKLSAAAFVKNEHCIDKLKCRKEWAELIILNIVKNEQNF
jgi:hypothetical protein